MKKLSSITGHEDIAKRLMENISAGHIGHAYIFEGEDVSGRNSLAEAFAAALLCEKGGEDACGSCHTCIQVETGNCMDLIYVAEDAKETKTGKIGVSEIRKGLVDAASIRPYAAKHRVFIVFEAQNMTAEAQNALLKTLEEPPEYVVILLVCDDADNLLETVRSRAETVQVGALTEAVVRKYLIREGIADSSKAALCAAIASGDLAEAKRLAESETFDELSHKLRAALKDIEQMSLRRMHELLNIISKDKENADIMLRIMRVWYRDVLLFKATRNVDSISLADEFRYISRCAAANEYMSLERAIQDVEKAQTRLNANVNQKLTMELLFLSLKENIK